MPTLAELEARIILDLARDDLGGGGELAQALADAIADAIESHADEAFWFNQVSAEAATVAGSAALALPAGMRSAASVHLAGAPLRKVAAADLQGRSGSGAPVLWAEDGGGLLLWPVPDAVYSLLLFGLAELGVPAASNAWTEAGSRLVLAGAKKILCRGPLRDPMGMELARDEEEEALASLRRETRRRAATGLVTDLPAAAATGCGR